VRNRGRSVGRGFLWARFLAGGNGRDAVVDGTAQLPASCPSGRFDVAQAEPEVGVGFVDGGADEGVVVVDPDLGDVAGVVADCDGVSDEGCKSRGEVALAMEMDAVALYDPVVRSGEKEPVELLEAVGHSG